MGQNHAETFHQKDGKRANEKMFKSLSIREIKIKIKLINLIEIEY